MTYLSIAKDMEKTKKRQDLMVRLTRLQAKFMSLWVNKEEIIAPYNEKLIKDTSLNTLDDFLIDFNGVVNGFVAEGMLLEHMEQYHNKFTTREDLKHYVDIGLVKKLNHFFVKIDTKLRTSRHIMDRLATKLEESLNSTSPVFDIGDLNLKKQDINMLKKGTSVLTSSGVSWVGETPTVTTEELETLKGDDFRNAIKPLAIEYRYLEGYLTDLLTSAKGERIYLEIELLTNQYKLQSLDNRMEEYLSQQDEAYAMKFSEMQRVIVAKFYMDNKKNNTTRQCLEEESATKDLFIRYESLMYLLFAEFGIKNNINGLNRIIYKGRFSTEYLTDVEKSMHSIYQSVASEIASTSIKYEEMRYGVLEYKHIRILTLVLELHKTVADIIYRNPTFTGLFINLQFIMANFFVQLNPSNRHIAENLKIFPFRLGDGIIEGFLINKGLDILQPEPTVEDLITLIAKRNKLALDLDKSHSGVLSALDKAIEREEIEETEEYKQKSLKEVLEDISKNGHEAMAYLRTFN